MKIRHVDFLSDDEFRALSSYKADTQLLVTGAACLILMTSVLFGIMMLR